MDKFIKSIDKQIAFNQSKNIFLDQPENRFGFITGTVNAISSINELNKESENHLIDYATRKALEEFCRINQYYSFPSQSKKELRAIYVNLFSVIRSGSCSSEEIARNHYHNLKRWITNHNPFASKLYSKANEFIAPVCCSEYSPGLQLDILRVDLEQLMQPVLDIGCGQQGNLVKYLSQKGIEAYGIDRFFFTDPNLLTSDWLEHSYGIEKWGTIISNISYSNHFKHHHLRADGNYIAYAKTYMNILHALKIGASFHYAPDLPFIETYLDKNHYDLAKYPITGHDFKSTTIKRLK